MQLNFYIWNTKENVISHSLISDSPLCTMRKSVYLMRCNRSLRWYFFISGHFEQSIQTLQHFIPKHICLKLLK